MVNEVLCQLVCHNLCVLVQESHELGIAPLFWQDEPNVETGVLVIRYALDVRDTH